MCACVGSGRGVYVCVNANLSVRVCMCVRVLKCVHVCACVFVCVLFYVSSFACGGTLLSVIVCVWMGEGHACMHMYTSCVCVCMLLNTCVCVWVGMWMGARTSVCASSRVCVLNCSLCVNV